MRTCEHSEELLIDYFNISICLPLCEQVPESAHTTVTYVASPSPSMLPYGTTRRLIEGNGIFARLPTVTKGALALADTPLKTSHDSDEFSPPVASPAVQN